MFRISWALAGGVLLAFLSGSVLYSSLIPKALCRKDPARMSPDGNPGAFNAFRYAGKAVGALCLFCDIAKGTVPVMLLAPFFRNHPVWLGALIAAPVAGHVFSPFAGMHGGKGIAVSFGVLLALFPQSYALAWLAGLYILFSLAVRVAPNQWRSVLTFFCFGALALWLEPSAGVRIGAALISLLVLYRHCIGISQVPMEVRLFRGRRHLLPSASQGLARLREALKGSRRD